MHSGRDLGINFKNSAPKSRNFGVNFNSRAQAFSADAVLKPTSAAAVGDAN
ncbi:hypothetical protein CAMGR0001_0578 [Campylobacter gracilis RM3268]|uniref:Uncharacterized protein n=1 Tax=Campylobacter gracilis RM3268 TaxID=553220 RepID=C8PHY2_9BACT|nr:hypothetical protein CAMGR0001_0578 [Campylobacter gracilis RM3268]